MPATPATQRPVRSWTTILDGQQLRQLRRQRELSQEKLADLAGVSPATVARLERQHRSPCRGRTLARLAAALGERPAAISPSESAAADVPATCGERVG
jgi:transcriptional regulator with XRE-family HTH domain